MPIATWNGAEVCLHKPDGRLVLNQSGNPDLSSASNSPTPWPAPDQRQYRSCPKKRRRRRRSGRPGGRTIFGSFKLPEELMTLTGFKKPRRPTASETPPSPETPTNLCKDGFDNIECIPGGKSVFVPRNRHHEISGLGALSFGKPVSGKPARLSSPVSARSHVSATSGSSGEVDLFGAGRGCGFWAEPFESAGPADDTILPDVQRTEGVAGPGMEHGLFPRLDEGEFGSKVLVRQTPEGTGSNLRTPSSVPENPSVPETPARNRRFDSTSPSHITQGMDGVENCVGGRLADNLIRRNTTRGERDCRSRRAADSVFIPRKQSRRALSAGFSGGRGYSPELY